MSNFQLGLIIAGALVLVVVVAYNAWTERRNTPKRARASDPQSPSQQPQQPQGDGAPQAFERHEPAFDDAPLAFDDAALAASGAHPAPAEPVLGEAPAPVVLASGAHERRALLDPLIDAIVALALEQLASGDAALAALPATRRVGSKPFAIEGLSDASGQWEPPQPGQRYRAFQAGVQLANRLGALSEIEFSEFVVKVQGFADALGAAPEFLEMRDEVARARELDQFASEHDAQLSFVLRARQAAWSPGYVLQNAAQLGFVPGALPGRLVLPARLAGLPPLLTLAYDAQAAMADEPEQSALREVTLSLDVAHVHRSEQPFVRLREVADELARAMDGVLCDQQGTVLPAMAMEPIAADLEQLYDQLDERELSAGSPLARRLFS